MPDLRNYPISTRPLCLLKGGDAFRGSLNTHLFVRLIPSSEDPLTDGIKSRYPRWRKRVLGVIDRSERGTACNMDWRHASIYRSYSHNYSRAQRLCAVVATWVPATGDDTHRLNRSDRPSGLEDGNIQEFIERKRRSNSL